MNMPMDILMMTLNAIPEFALYFISSLILLILFKLVYTKITPYNEWQLVKEEQNHAAAITLSGAMIGYALALSGVINHSESWLDFLIWASIGFVAQVIAFLMVRFIFLPQLIRRINENEIPAGLIMGAASISIGLLNSACMSY